MTLKKKLQERNVYINPHTFKLTKEGAENFEELFDEFAIKVLEFYHNGLFFIPLKDGEAKEILNYIKKEKSL